MFSACTSHHKINSLRNSSTTWPLHGHATSGCPILRSFFLPQLSFEHITNRSFIIHAQCSVCAIFWTIRAIGRTVPLRACNQQALTFLSFLSSTSRTVLLVHYLKTAKTTYTKGASCNCQKNVRRPVSAPSLPPWQGATAPTFFTAPWAPELPHGPRGPCRRCRAATAPP